MSTTVRVAIRSTSLDRSANLVVKVEARVCCTCSIVARAVKQNIVNHLREQSMLGILACEGACATRKQNSMDSTSLDGLVTIVCLPSP